MGPFRVSLLLTLLGLSSQVSCPFCGIGFAVEMLYDQMICVVLMVS